MIWLARNGFRLWWFTCWPPCRLAWLWQLMCKGSDRGWQNISSEIPSQWKMFWRKFALRCMPYKRGYQGENFEERWTSLKKLRIYTNLCSQNDTIASRKASLLRESTLNLDLSLISNQHRFLGIPLSNNKVFSGNKPFLAKLLPAEGFLYMYCTEGGGCWLRALGMSEVGAVWGFCPTRALELHFGSDEV